MSQLPASNFTVQNNLPDLITKTRSDEATIGVGIGPNGEARKAYVPGIKRSKAITLAFMAGVALSLSACDSKPDKNQFSSLEECEFSFQYSKEKCQEVYGNRLDQTNYTSNNTQTFNNQADSSQSIVSSNLNNSFSPVIRSDSDLNQNNISNTNFFILYTHWNYGPYGLYDNSPFYYSTTRSYSSTQKSSLINRTVNPVRTEQASYAPVVKSSIANTQANITRTANAFAVNQPGKYSTVTTSTSISNTSGIAPAKTSTYSTNITASKPVTYSSAGLGTSGARISSFSSSGAGG